jgi:hypothetical protein
MGLSGSAWTRVLGRQKLEITLLLSLSLSSGPSPLGDGRGADSGRAALKGFLKFKWFLRTEFAGQRSEDAVVRRRIRESQYWGNKNYQCLPWPSQMPLLAMTISVYLCIRPVPLAQELAQWSAYIHGCFIHVFASRHNADRNAE